MFVKGCGHETYNTKEVEKEHKEEATADQETPVEEGQEAPVPLATHVSNILNSIFSNDELYINSQRNCNSKVLYAHKSYIFNNFKGAISEYKEVLHCEGYDYEKFLDEIMEAPLFEHFITRRLKMPSRPDGFMLYGKMRVDFFSTSEFLYPNLKSRLRLIRARKNFYMISDIPIVSLGTVPCSHYTCSIALKDDYHKKRMDMLT